MERKGSAAIRPINRADVHRICAGQVILDLSSAVKELVENSLDAGATSIEIALKDYGQEYFQVVDNGSGISPENFKVLALKHHTSKLLSFNDLQSLATFGFRGEALSSLCALGDLTVETRTANEAVATHLTYDRSGVLMTERKTARQVGTTVTVKKLFSNFPVRCKEFHRNIRKEFGKLVSLLNAYALIAKGVRLVCTNTTGKSIRSVVLKTQGSGFLKDNIIMVFGLSTFSCLEPITLKISDDCVVEGFVSKSGNGSGRNIGDRQFFFVNGRPVDMPKVGKLVNELYRGVNSKQYPIAIMNFFVPAQAYDVNVTPDKRKIFFPDESSFLQCLREALEKIYSSDQVSYQVSYMTEINEKNLTTGDFSVGEGSPLHPKQLFHDGYGVHEEKDYKTCTNENFARKKSQDKVESSSVKEVRRIDEASSIIEGFSLSGLYNQMKKDSKCPAEQHKNVASLRTEVNSSLQSSPHQKCSADNGNSQGGSIVVQTSLNKFITLHKRKHEKIDEILSEIPLLKRGPAIRKLRGSSSPEHGASPRSRDFDEVIDSDKNIRSDKPHNSSIFSGFGESETSCLVPCDDREQSKASTSRKRDKSFLIPCVDKKQARSPEKILLLEKAEDRLKDADFVPIPAITKSAQPVSDDPTDASTPLRSLDVSADSPVVSSESKVGFSLEFSFKDLMSRRKQRLSRLQYIHSTRRRVKLSRGFAAASLELSQSESKEGKTDALAAASRELEKLFKKEDFQAMKVIGQFNLGFIIAKLDQDLFIVDQHAADEKYNFERLSQSTILNQQPLFRPITVELSPEEEIIISMNLDTFRKNGFTLEEDMHAPPGHRFKLKAVPFSKNIMFGVADVKELVSILSDSNGECSMIGSYRSDTADSVCPPKLCTMLASRACRSSVMIGDPLGRIEMKKILEHLALLKSPWNCPHGRPTMRHLVDLRTVHGRLCEADEIEL